MQLHPTRCPSTTELDLDDTSSGPGTNSDGTETPSVARSKRSGSIASWNSISRDTFVSSGALSSAGLSVVQRSLNSSTTSFQHSPGVESKSLGAGSLNVVYDRSWEVEMEVLLKVRFGPFLLGIRLTESVDVGHVWCYQEPTDSATVWYGYLESVFLLCSLRLDTAHHLMARSRSLRGGPPDRLTTLKRGSIRGIQSILGAPYSPYSSNSSIDGRASPSPSFATSTHEVCSPKTLHIPLLTHCFRDCTVPWRRSSRPHSVSRPTCPTRSYVKLRKTKIGASTATIPPRRRLASRTRNWRCSVHHGRRRVCSVASTTANLLGSERDPRIGSTSL